MFDISLFVLLIKILVMSNNSFVYIFFLVFLNMWYLIGFDLDNNNILDILFIVNVFLCFFSYVDMMGNLFECDCDVEEILYSGIIFDMGLIGFCKLCNIVYEFGSFKFEE